MVHTLAHIMVTDYTQWRAVYDSVDGLRMSHGCTGARVFQSAENPNDIHILLSWGDQERAQAYYASPELREAMQRGGLQGPPTITYVVEM